MTDVTIDLVKIRMASWTVAGGMRLPRNDALPLLDRIRIERSKDEIVDRAFAMNCVAATAYGFDRQRGWDWLIRNGGIASLTDDEKQFLEGSRGASAAYMQQIEGLLALCWALSIVDQLDHRVPCPNDFVKVLPDLKKDEPSEQFKVSACLRSSAEIISQCDLVYCIHWGVVASELKAKATPLKRWIVVERRRALEWLVCSDAWDEVMVDT